MHSLAAYPNQHPYPTPPPRAIPCCPFFIPLKGIFVSILHTAIVASALHPTVIGAGGDQQPVAFPLDHELIR